VRASSCSDPVPYPPRSLCQQPSSRRGVYGSNVIESTGQETRAFILQARHTLVTSQPEATLSLSFSLSLSLCSLCLPFMPRFSPSIPFRGSHHRRHRYCHCIEISRAYKSPWAPHIIPPNYSRGVAAAAALEWGSAEPARSKLTRRRLFYFSPQSRRVRPADGNQARGFVARFARPNDHNSCWETQMPNKQTFFRALVVFLRLVSSVMKSISSIYVQIFIKI